MADRNALSFEATLVSVYKLFKDQEYLIPAYQRDYSWDTEQWDQLWGDLSDFDKNASEEHFLGPLIVTPSDEGSDTYEVIDGQQRLTTLQIIIAIIRDAWIQKGDKNSTIEGVSVPNQKMTADLIFSLTPAVRHNFIPNKHLRLIFKDFIQTAHGQPGKKHFENKETLLGYQYNDRASEVVRAYKYFSTRINAFSDDDLRKFEKYLLHKVRLLKVVAGGSSNAFLLFETLNYRGLELTQTDLVKSYLFSRILVDDPQDQLVNEWDRVVDNIGNKSPDLFLRHYLLLYNKKVLKRDIYGEIKDGYKSREDAIQFVRDLSRFSNLYSYLVREKEFDGPNSRILNVLFDDLSLLNVDTQNIYLLAILFQFYSEKTKVDVDKIENAARLSETLSFRWITCGRNAQDLETIYQEAAGKIMDTITPEDNFEDAQKLILDSLPSDLEFEAALQNAIIKSNRRGQYILRKIDEWQNGDASSYVLMDASKLHLEHIAPQRPSQDSDWKTAMKGDLNYRDVIYRIGNMMLLRDRVNRDVSNLQFQKKLAKYEAQKKKTKMPLPQLSEEVLTYEKWNQEIVQERSKAIASIAKLVWSAESTNLKGKAKEMKKTRKKSNKKTRK
jgi:uncharacterized protein with ParB-like and HNH nuclease domain